MAQTIPTDNYTPSDINAIQDAVQNTVDAYFRGNTDDTLTIANRVGYTNDDIDTIVRNARANTAGNE